MERLELQEHKVMSGQLALQELRALLAIQARLVLQVCLVMTEPRAAREQREIKEQLVLLGLTEQREPLVLRELQG
jgi:hypothetical protein